MRTAGLGRASAAVFCLLLTACQSGTPAGSSTGVARPAGQAPFSLPAPSTLQAKLHHARSRTASYLNADLLMQAEDFDPTFPNQRVVATANGAAFSPALDLVTHFKITRLAYAMYHTQIKNYDGTKELHYGWVSPPADPANVYFGFGNWYTDSWDWYQGNAAGKLSLPTLNPYFTFTDDMLVCVLMVKPDFNELDWLRIGSTPPAATLTAGPAVGPPGADIRLDASGSTAGDAAITEYRWDPEGDGTFQVSTGTISHLHHTYPTSGIWHAAVEVFDSNGMHGEATVDVHVLSTLNLSYGEPTNQETATCAAPTSNGDLLVFGQVWNNINLMPVASFITRITPGGSAVFTRQWGSGGEAAQVAASGDGYFYLAGSGSVEKWDENGNLVWSKSVSVGGGGYLSLMSVAYDAGKAYAVGQLEDGTSEFQFVLCLNGDGTLAWAKEMGASIYASEEFRDVTIRTSSSAPGDTLECCGSWASGAQFDLLHASFDLSGNLQLAEALGDSSLDEYGEGIKAAGPDGDVIVLAQQVPATGNPVSLLAVAQGASKLLSFSGDALDGSSLVWTGGTGLAALCGTNTGTSLLRLDTSLAVSSAELFTSATGGAIGRRLENYFGLPLIVGVQSGPLPTTSAATVTSADSGLTWQTLSPTVTDATPTIADQAETVADVSTYVFDSGLSDGDAWLYLEAN